jgi:hypothetical protein
MLLQLPCTPRAYAYLKIRYGKLLKLNHTDKVAGYIYNCLLAGRSDQWLENYYQEKDFDVFPVRITDFQRFVEKLGGKVHARSVSYINDFLEGKFDDLFYSRVTELVYMRRIPKELAITTFMLAYDIDEERLSYESLAKRYYRYRKKNKEFEKKLICHNVPECNTVKNEQHLTLRISKFEAKKLKEASTELGMDRSKIIRSLIIKNISNAQFKTTKTDDE